MVLSGKTDFTIICMKVLTFDSEKPLESLPTAPIPREMVWQGFHGRSKNRIRDGTDIGYAAQWQWQIMAWEKSYINQTKNLRM